MRYLAYFFLIINVFFLIPLYVDSAEGEMYGAILEGGSINSHDLQAMPEGPPAPEIPPTGPDPEPGPIPPEGSLK
jgi:hypothetical protein